MAPSEDISIMNGLNPSNMLPKDVQVSLKKSPPGQSPPLWQQGFRLLLFIVWFTLTSLAIVTTQFIGSPLYLIDKKLFYAYVLHETLLSIQVYSNYEKELWSYGHHNNSVVCGIHGIADVKGLLRLLSLSVEMKVSRGRSKRLVMEELKPILPEESCL